MDPSRLKAAYQRLESLDERLGYKIKPRSVLSRPTQEQINDQLKDVSLFTLELKEVVRDLFQAIAARNPGAKQAEPPPRAQP